MKLRPSDLGRSPDELADLLIEQSRRHIEQMLYRRPLTDEDRHLVKGRAPGLSTVSVGSFQGIDIRAPVGLAKLPPVVELLAGTGVVRWL